VDPEFFTFSKTLESYGMLGENTTLMIEADSDFFRYLESTAQP
jgi:membrane protease subunit HflC